MIELRYRYTDGVLQSRNLRGMRITDKGEEPLESDWANVPKVDDLVARLLADTEKAVAGRYVVAADARFARLTHDVHHARTAAVSWKVQAFKAERDVRHLGKTAAEWFAIAKKRKADGNWLAAEMRTARAACMDWEGHASTQELADFHSLRSANENLKQLGKDLFSELTKARAALASVPETYEKIIEPIAAARDKALKEVAELSSERDTAVWQRNAARLLVDDGIAYLKRVTSSMTFSYAGLLADDLAKQREALGK